MDDIMSELNERLTASCRETLQQLDDIEAKLAGLHAAIFPQRRGRVVPGINGLEFATFDPGRPDGAPRASMAPTTASLLPARSGASGQSDSR